MSNYQGVLHPHTPLIATALHVNMSELNEFLKTLLHEDRGRKLYTDKGLRIILHRDCLYSLKFRKCLFKIRSRVIGD
jgi:hypothetical protein